MKYTIPKSIMTPFLVLFGIALLGLFTYFFHRSDDRATKADAFYHAGEVAKNIAERKKAFNDALSLYMQLEEDYKPQFGNGKLYYNLGNTYFQLGEYPWAIFYYLKAQALMPRAKGIETSLSLARNKLSLPQTEASSLAFLSLPERLQMFGGLIIIAFILLSAWIWTDNNWFKKGAFALLALATIILLTLGYSRYLSPLEGVLVQASDLYRDAGQQYAKVGEEPLPAGSVVEVLGSESKGLWFKVLTPKGAVGYVPQEAIRSLP